MRRKGFTLIELLAVIVILLILVIVSTPSILNLLNNSKDLTKNTVEEKLIDAAKEYATSYNRGVLNDLKTVGDVKTITADTLIAAGLIKEEDIDILEEDTVFVKITLQEDNKLDYTVLYDPDLLEEKSAHITLLGSNPTFVEKNHPYIESGYTAINSLDQDVTDQVDVTGNTINTAVAGTYTITYTAIDNTTPVEATRTVIVVDSSVLGVAYASMSTNNTTNTEKAKNGDIITLSITFTRTITNTPTVTIGGRAATITGSGLKRTATYTIPSNESTLTESALGISITNYIDVNNNVGPAVTTVNGNSVSYDRANPSITLSGNNPVLVTLGGTYTDAGATASDNIDLNLTLNIVTTNNVNTNIPGIYTVTYNVTDSSGNVATPVTRTVIVGDVVFTFTNAAATGYAGPTQAQLNTAYAGTSLAANVTSNSGIQIWTVPITGNYKIEAWGAQGGLGACNGTPGNGAYVSGNFSLTSGDKLLIIAGQEGSDNTTTGLSDGTAGAGGGGSFVVKKNDAATDTMTVAGTVNGWKVTPLIIAAGGNGGRDICYSGSGTLYHGQIPGGSAPTYASYYGGGFNAYYSNTTAGVSFLGGGNGASANYSRSGTSIAGFGSGGGNKDDGEGGGGGGYYGGGPTVSAYSYNSGTGQTNQNGSNATNGKVVITYIQ